MEEDKYCMKILMVNKFLYPNGGSETYLFSIGRELQALGHEVQYFGMEHEGRIVGNHAESYTEDMSFRSGEQGENGMSGKLRKKLSQLTYPFKIIYSLDAKKKIRKVLEDFHPDVVHLNNINFQITPSVIDEIKSFDLHIRIVYTAHDSQWVCPNHLMRIPSTGELCSRCLDGDVCWCTKNRCIHNSRIQSLLGTVEASVYQHRKNYEKVDAVIAPSKFMGDTLAHNPKIKGKITVLHNPLNPLSTGEVKKPDACEVQNHALRQVIEQLPENYVLYFGRYSEEKGIRTAVQAVRKLPDISFVFAGKGELEQEVSAVPNIRNVGFLSGEQMLQTIQRAKFVIFPSECYENCPYSVAEAELAMTPVIASRIGGIPELLVDGVTGELFEAGNAPELADKIRNLWENGAKLSQYREGCRRLAEGKLELSFDTIEKYCERLLDIYQGR